MKSSLFFHIIPLLTFVCVCTVGGGDNLRDICPTDTKTVKTLFFNGLPCKNPAEITAADFKTSLLNQKGETHNLYRSSVTMITAEQLPGLNTLGISASRTDLEIDGLIMPHAHPRASEIVYVGSGGSVMVGFIDSKNNLFQKVLKKGDVFVFPRGLLHYCLNYGFEAATVYSVMNSQNPGQVSVSVSDAKMALKLAQRFKSVSRLGSERLENFTLFHVEDLFF